jgi:hypothetical protein
MCNRLHNTTSDINISGLTDLQYHCTIYFLVTPQKIISWLEANLIFVSMVLASVPGGSGTVEVFSPQDGRRYVCRA